MTPTLAQAPCGAHTSANRHPVAPRALQWPSGHLCLDVCMFLPLLQVNDNKAGAIGQPTGEGSREDDGAADLEVELVGWDSRELEAVEELRRVDVSMATALV